MNDLIIYSIILAVWFILQLWVLPKLGIPTCMSGACRVPTKPKSKETEAQPVDEKG
jgi:hypothetical protein